MELLQYAHFDDLSRCLEEYVELLGLRFLHEEAKHGTSAAEYRRDENCVRIAPYLRGYERLWILLHELGHHVSGASDTHLIDGDAGVTEAIADYIAIGVLQRLGLPVSGPERHLDLVRDAFPSARGAEERYQILVEECVGMLVRALQR